MVIEEDFIKISLDWEEQEYLWSWVIEVEDEGLSSLCLNLLISPQTIIHLCLPQNIKYDLPIIFYNNWFNNNKSQFKKERRIG